MDSAGLHVVLAGNRTAAACDASLVFMPSPAVVRMFELSGADRVLTVNPDLPDAVAAKGAQRAKFDH